MPQFASGPLIQREAAVLMEASCSKAAYHERPGLADDGLSLEHSSLRRGSTSEENSICGWLVESAVVLQLQALVESRIEPC